MPIDEKKIEELKALFEPFLKNNSYSSIKADDDGDLEIVEPWGDASLGLMVVDPENRAKEAADAINPLILPQRFSALWHTDKSELEVIWTAFTLTDRTRDINGRKFNFEHRGTKYSCEFGPSSSRLLKIAEMVLPVAASRTAYRNIQPFQYWAGQPEERRSAIGTPLSFWVRGATWDEDAFLDLAYHLNFYMTYFDAYTPNIIVHPAPSEEKTSPRNRYIRGTFPSDIRSKAIDTNLLHFWAAAGSTDQSRTFLYCYRIIEYCSLYYMNESMRGMVRKLLARPDVLNNIPGLTEELMLATLQGKREESQRIEALLSDTVDPMILWEEIQKNLDAFCSETNFDGGFVLKSLISKTSSPEQFKVSGIETFAARTRDIRNALSHGRDMKTAGVIAPTHRNYTLLEPWAILMSVASFEVILYERVV